MVVIELCGVVSGFCWYCIKGVLRLCRGSDKVVLRSEWLPPTRDGHQDVETFQDLHLLEAPTSDEVVHLPLTTTVQQHQPVLCPHQEVNT